jgi:Alpha-amylase C-terminal beta-sheet domain
VVLPPLAPAAFRDAAKPPPSPSSLLILPPLPWLLPLQCILDLLAVRKKHQLDCRAKVTVRKAAGDVYAATINDKVAVKIGRGDWSPNMAKIEAPGGKQWVKACSGKDWACWEVGMRN